MFFQPLRTYIDVKFHGESISDGFRAIWQRKVCQKSKIPKKIAKLENPANPLSRSSPDATVGGAHNFIAGFCFRKGKKDNIIL